MLPTYTHADLCEANCAQFINMVLVLLLSLSLVLVLSIAYLLHYMHILCVVCCLFVVKNKLITLEDSFLIRNNFD